MKIIGFLLVFALAEARHEHYIGWKSYYVGPSAPEHFEVLWACEEQYELDFLSRPSVAREGVVLVKPQFQEFFIQELDAAGISYRIHVENVKRQLDIEDTLILSQKSRSFARNGGKRLPYDAYQELEVIENYIDDIAREYPEVVTLVEPAVTFEGRPIKYLKISTTNFEDESKPVIFIEGGIHAREWITIPTITWAIHKLVENVTEKDLLDRFDWILLPVANPDGYEFSYTTNRMWRKNRFNDGTALGALCLGVDGNRNFDFFWNTAGTSTNRCMDNYGGSGPFSEVETQVIRDILHEHKSRIALYITMHSFGSYILYGWGHDGSLSPNAFNLHTVGVAMAQTIDRHSPSNYPNYVVGNSALVLNYRASGAGEDYAHQIGVPLSYTYELPGLGDGFILSPIHINQIVRETWEGLVVGARSAGDLF